MSLLEIRDISIKYQTGIKAVDSVSFSVEEGEIVTIVGESGSGKTTLIRAILGLLPPGGVISSGSILFDGIDLAKSDEKTMTNLRGRQISMIFQDVGLSMDPTQKIKTQYLESIRVHQKISKAEAYRMAADMLRMMQLTDVDRVMNAYPFELSGGMKQRVGIAMSMTSAPKILLADEPTSALDVTIQAQVVSQMKRLRDEYNKTIILVTHNMGVASYLSDKIGVMKSAKLVEFGTRDEIIYHPKEEYTKNLLRVVPSLRGERYAK